ncbi:MAG TPA: hypothetical protein VF157_06705, partial [Chloroflexota bacterium]
VSQHIMHRRLLRGHELRWYGRDIGLPLAACLAVAGLARVLLPETDSRLALFGWLALIIALCYAVAGATLPWIRTKGSSMFLRSMRLAA